MRAHARVACRHGRPDSDRSRSACSHGLVLLVHRHPLREWYPDCWDLVGGHVEKGESPGEAVIRECLEELGVHLSAARVATGKPPRTGPEISHLAARACVLQPEAPRRDPPAPINKGRSPASRTSSRAPQSTDGLSHDCGHADGHQHAWKIRPETRDVARGRAVGEVFGVGLVQASEVVRAG